MIGCWLVAWGAGLWHSTVSAWGGDSLLSSSVTQMLWLSISHRKYRWRSQSGALMPDGAPHQSCPQWSVLAIPMQWGHAHAVLWARYKGSGSLGQCLPWKWGKDKWILSWLIQPVSCPSHCWAFCLTGRNSCYLTTASKKWKIHM